MQPEALLELARHIVEHRRRRPSQVSLRRALSTIYYALFHALAWNGADKLVGKTASLRAGEAWQMAYRGIEHGRANAVFRNGSFMARLSPALREFGGFFIEMQNSRHQADYNPHANFTKSFVLRRISDAERAIARFRAANAADRQKLSVRILFISRRPWR